MIPFDPATRTVTGPTGCVTLTPTRAAVLAAIPKFPEAISTTDLLRKVWGTHSKAALNKNVARVTVNHIRGQLADAGFPWSTIVCEYRRGYSVRA